MAATSSGSSARRPRHSGATARASAARGAASQGPTWLMRWGCMLVNHSLYHPHSILSTWSIYTLTHMTTYMHMHMHMSHVHMCMHMHIMCMHMYMFTCACHTRSTVPVFFCKLHVPSWWNLRIFLYSGSGRTSGWSSSPFAFTHLSSCWRRSCRADLGDEPSTRWKL